MSDAGSMILVFQWTIDILFFLLQNRLFDSIFGKTYKGEHNYQHLAIIVRPVMQSMLGALLCVFQ